MATYPVEVGKLYVKGRTYWEDSYDYKYSSGSRHELVLFYANPSRQEVASITKGHTRLGFLELPDCIFFLFKFGALPWGASHYNWHRVPPERQQIPPTLSPSEQALLTVILVDASTGIVKGNRVLTMSHDLSAALHQAIARQADDSGPGSQYWQIIDDSYRQFPSALDMVNCGQAVLQ